jgi:hypothetical protein
MPGFEITRVTSKQPDGSFVTQRPEEPEGELVLPKGHVLERASLKVGDSWYKTKRSDEAWAREAIEEMFKDYRGKSEFIKSPEISDEELLSVYPVSDFHHGMLAWGHETGVNWDLKIARETLLSCISQVIQCTPSSETCIFLDLGDWSHANSQANATPASGHQLDVDGRFPKIAKESVKLKRDLIELLLQKHKYVIYRGLPGNHDPEVQQLLSIALSIFFENNPRVTVDDDPSDFWFYEHGLVMLAANHGHKTKPEKLPGIMASYRPKMWGRTKFRRAFSGHIHHTKSGEHDGARWETLRTVAPKDSFAHQHGYSAGRELISETYHLNLGFRTRQIVEIK